jgi:uncharacterized damage-inducible protein DinB
MARGKAKSSLDLGEALAESFAVNERMNQIVLERLDPRAWRAKLPGERTRTIAAIFSHVHNIRRKWLRLSAPHLKLPKPLNRSQSTQEQTRVALGESAARCCEMIREALREDGRVEQFLRDGWAKPWPAGAAMVAYMIIHDAHHRGQACLLAHQLGYPLRGDAAYGIWAWEKLWKECGFTRLR